jgi:hypothetical protein
MPATSLSCACVKNQSEDENSIGKEDASTTQSQLGKVDFILA